MHCSGGPTEYSALQQIQESPPKAPFALTGFDPENDTMAYARTADGQYEFFATPKSKPQPQPQPWRGLFSRLFDSLAEGRRRAAEREIAVYLEGRGKFLTDDAERQIERILSSSSRF
jgi:hypothetical protein